MVAQVFISHSSKDRKVARTICSALESRGVTCWIASRDVGPGENFMDAIVRAIRVAKVMVLVFSENANNSDEIKREVVLAGNAKVTVIPVRVEDVVPSDAFAYQFATRQWIDLFEDWENQLERLATWVARIAAAASPASVATAKGTTRGTAPDSISDAPLVATESPPALVIQTSESPGSKAPPSAKEAAAPLAPPADLAPMSQSQDTFAHRLATEADASVTGSPTAEIGEPATRTKVRPSRRAVVIGCSAATAVGIGGGALLYLGGPIRTFYGDGGGVKSVAFSPDGRTALSGSRYVTLWDIATGKEIWKDVNTHEGSVTSVTSVVFSPDGRTALSGAWDHTMALSDIATSNVVRTFNGHSSVVTSVAFSPDGQTALSASNDRSLKLWDIASGSSIRTFEDKEDILINSVAILPDGRTALSAGSLGLKLWDIASGTMIRRILAEPDLSRIGNSRESLAISPDGRTVLSGGPFSPYLIFSNIDTGEVIRTFDVPDSVRSVAISPDGTMALCAGDDGTPMLWDCASATLLRTFKRHSGRINSVAFSPDGRTALSGSDDGTLKLWAVPQ